MRDIGEHNYEELFFDYHEGLLNEEEKSLVEAFLLKNPEYQEDFDAFAETVLRAPDIDLNWKESLKKSEQDLASAEDNIVAVVEGLLDESSLENVLGQSSKAQEDLRVYRLIKLRASEKTYPNKEELKASMNGLPLFLEDQLTALESKYSLQPDLTKLLPNKESLKKETRGILMYLNSLARVAAAVAVLVVMTWFALLRERPSALLGSKVDSVEVVKRLANAGTNGILLEEGVKPESDILTTHDALKKNTHVKNEYKDRKESIDKINKRSVRNIEQELVARLAFPELPKLNAVDVDPHTAGNAKVLASNHSSNTGPDRQKEMTLAEFAKRKISQELVSKPNPEEGLALALLDKAVEKLDERSDRNLDLDLNEADNGTRGFELNIGKLKIKR